MVPLYMRQMNYTGYQYRTEKIRCGTCMLAIDVNETIRRNKPNDTEINHKQQNAKQHC